MTTHALVDRSAAGWKAKCGVVAKGTAKPEEFSTWASDIDCPGCIGGVSASAKMDDVRVPDQGPGGELDLAHQAETSDDSVGSAIRGRRSPNANEEGPCRATPRDTLF